MAVFSSTKLLVFVSSTIHEAIEERRAAKEAIESLNHEALLFEETGARATTPRAVYLNHIAVSHIFVGIYKESRGWVGQEIGVSGIEDEYRYASKRGMPRLIYVQTSSGQPPPWIGKLSDKMTQDGVSVFFYGDNRELVERLRNDIEFLVTEKFAQASRFRLLQHISPAQILQAALPDSRMRLPRDAVEVALITTLSIHHKTLLYAPMAFGKTVFLAQISDKHNFLFIRAAGRDTPETLLMVAALLHQFMGHVAQDFMDPSRAEEVFVNTWRATQGFTLVIDDCKEPDRLLELVGQAEGVGTTRQLVVSAHANSSRWGAATLELPGLSNEEIATLFEIRRGASISSLELEQLSTYSKRNPLYVRYYVESQSSELLTTISDYEINHYLTLSSHARELLSYISLAETAVPLDFLRDLVSPGDSIESLTPLLKEASHLLAEEPQGINVIHPHLRETIREIVARNPAKHRYYANHLADTISEISILDAFFILDRANESRARQLARRASFEAELCGDLGRAIYIYKKRLIDAEELIDYEEKTLIALALADIFSRNGDKHSSYENIDIAENASFLLKDESLQMLVREQKAMLGLRFNASQDCLCQLNVLLGHYQKCGNSLAVARLQCQLSSIYIHLHDFQDAAAAAQSALDFFSSSGNTHGMHVAKVNLAAALGSIDSQDHRALELLKELKAPEGTQDRMRAWTCNMMTRRLRQQGAPERALSYAGEAIGIGEKCQDAYLVAINQINAGNALRDLDRLDEALAMYESASKSAHASGFVEIEASALELSSNIWQIKGSWQRAEHFARCAAGLVRGTAAVLTFARAMDELAGALDAQRRSREATIARLDGAKALGGNCNHLDMFYNLTRQGLMELVESEEFKEYALHVSDLFKLVPLESVPERTTIEDLFYQAHRLVEQIPVKYIVLFFGIHYRVIFSNIDKNIARFLMQELVKRLLPKSQTISKQTTDEQQARRLLALLPLLASVPIDAWQFTDISRYCEAICHTMPGLHFKPGADGSCNWVVRLNFSTPVILSIHQLDDYVETALVTMILVLLLKGYEEDIQAHIIKSSLLTRTEVEIVVCSFRDFRALIDPQCNFIAEPITAACAVTRPTKPDATEHSPTFVICNDNIAKMWHAGQGKGSALQVIFGLTLLEIVYQLFAGEIDFEVLRPKITAIVRSSVS